MLVRNAYRFFLGLHGTLQRITSWEWINKFSWWDRGISPFRTSSIWFSSFNRAAVFRTVLPSLFQPTTTTATITSSTNHNHHIFHFCNFLNLVIDLLHLGNSLSLDFPCHQTDLDICHNIHQYHTPFCYPLLPSILHPTLSSSENRLFIQATCLTKRISSTTLTKNFRPTKPPETSRPLLLLMALHQRKATWQFLEEMPTKREVMSVFTRLDFGIFCWSQSFSGRLPTAVSSIHRRVSHNFLPSSSQSVSSIRPSIFAERVSSVIYRICGWPKEVSGSKKLYFVCNWSCSISRASCESHMPCIHCEWARGRGSGKT